MSESPDSIEIRRWESSENAPFMEPVFIRDDVERPGDLSLASVILPLGGEARARELLAKGAERVLFAEAALLDGDLVRRMAETFGPERVGVWLPVKRMDVSWSLDMVSNADFKCMTPSIGEPGWEVVKANGDRTGTDAAWWLGMMLERGASLALLSADYQDDFDHNICATMVERYGDRLWLSPLTQQGDEWGAHAWHTFGAASRLVLPPGMAMESESKRVAEAVEPLP